jgi:hypothetical protein
MRKKKSLTRIRQDRCLLHQLCFPSSTTILEPVNQNQVNYTNNPKPNILETLPLNVFYFNPKNKKKS